MIMINFKVAYNMMQLGNDTNSDQSREGASVWFCFSSLSPIIPKLGKIYFLNFGISTHALAIYILYGNSSSFLTEPWLQVGSKKLDFPGFFVLRVIMTKIYTEVYLVNFW